MAKDTTIPAKTIVPLAIVGAGGSGRETLCCYMDIYDLQPEDLDEFVVFLESDSVYRERSVNGVKVLPLSRFDPEKYEMVVSVGEPTDRKKIIEQLPAETRFATLIHPSVIMSAWVSVGAGSIIAAGSILTCNIKIGVHAQLNRHTNIGHDSEIGDFFTTAPGVVLSGNCSIGNEVYVGTNAAIKQKIKVCDNATIGMGAMVVKDIAEPGTYIGTPAKLLAK